MPDFTPFEWSLVGALVIAQFTLLGIAVARLIRTPDERLTLPRMAWALLLVLQFVGPIAFLIAGRRPAAVELESPAIREESALDGAIDELYGPR